MKTSRRFRELNPVKGAGTSRVNDEGFGIGVKPDVINRIRQQQKHQQSYTWSLSGLGGCNCPFPTFGYQYEWLSWRVWTGLIFLRMQIIGLRQPPPYPSILVHQQFNFCIRPKNWNQGNVRIYLRLSNSTLSSCGIEWLNFGILSRFCTKKTITVRSIRRGWGLHWV
jgi:hypothetical protein